MFKKFSVIVIIAIGFFVFRNGLPDFLGRFFSSIDLPDKAIEKINEIKKGNIQLFSDPLIKKGGVDTGALLNASVVIDLTNQERQKEGLPILIENRLLNEAAKAKTLDMFKNGYFEHVSPSGVGPSDVVTKVGYDYVYVGENLALGIFKDEADLVKAWMDSPGHRENILGKQFREIGVYVAKDNYKGEEVWIAVQEFGTSSSVCHKPEQEEKTDLENAYGVLSEFGNKMQTLESSINKMSKKDPNYKSVAESYNSLVDEYNNKIKEYRDKMSQYNLEVNTYNSCIDNLKS